VHPHTEPTAVENNAARKNQWESIETQGSPDHHWNRGRCERRGERTRKGGGCQKIIDRAGVLRESNGVTSSPRRARSTRVGEMRREKGHMGRHRQRQHRGELQKLLGSGEYRSRTVGVGGVRTWNCRKGRGRENAAIPGCHADRTRLKPCALRPKRPVKEAYDTSCWASQKKSDQ